MAQGKFIIVAAIILLVIVLLYTAPYHSGRERIIYWKRAPVPLPRSETATIVEEPITGCTQLQQTAKHAQQLNEIPPVYLPPYDPPLTSWA